MSVSVVLLLAILPHFVTCPMAQGSYPKIRSVLLIHKTCEQNLSVYHMHTQADCKHTVLDH